MTILLESDGTTAATLRGVLGPDSEVADNLNAVQALLTGSDSAAHDLVVVGPDVDLQEAVRLAASQRVARPDLGVVLLRRRLTSNLLREAMVSGVREVVPVDDIDGIADACRRSRELSQQVRLGTGMQGLTGSRPGNGKLVTVFAAKGGCGKTTLATNLATSLAKSGKRVCLLDLDLAFGDVAIAMQLSPTRSLADALALSALDESAVRSLVTPHPSGLDTILAPVEPGTAESISGALVGQLLALLKTLYDVVVVDSPPAFTDHVLAAFDQTDHFVLLATLDIPALKNLKLTLETLEMLAYPRERWHLVLNRSDAKVGLSVEDVERTLRAKIAVQVPSSRAVPASINRGVPIVLDQPGHPVSVAIKRFAHEQLAPAQPQVQTQAAAAEAFARVETAEQKPTRRGFSFRRKVQVA